MNLEKLSERELSNRKNLAKGVIFSVSAGLANFVGAYPSSNYGEFFVHLELLGISCLNSAYFLSRDLSKYINRLNR